MPAKKASQISPNASSVPPIPKNSAISSSSSASQSSKSALTSSSSSPSSSTSSKSNQSTQDVLLQLWQTYLDKTPQRVKLIDVFMVFLVLVGGLQFLYCLIVGNYPFNAFLAGFSATVGQFVLTASLRIQTNPANSKEFSQSPERAFADFVVGSLILQFFCVNFIN